MAVGSSDCVWGDIASSRVHSGDTKGHQLCHLIIQRNKEKVTPKTEAQTELQ